MKDSGEWLGVKQQSKSATDTVNQRAMSSTQWQPDLHRDTDVQALIVSIGWGCVKQKNCMLKGVLMNFGKGLRDVIRYSRIEFILEAYGLEDQPRLGGT